MKIEKNYLWLLLLCGTAIFFVNLHTLPVNIMEARNFITAREMLQDGNWLLTTLNGDPRYQKPPLPTWLTAFSAAIFGIKTVWALRLPAAIMALFLVAISYKFAKKLTATKTYAFLSALIMATSFYIVASARNGQWDIYSHACMMGCIYFLFLFFTGETHKYRNAILAGLLFGCSFLSKGPVSVYVLLLPFLVSYGIVFKYGRIHFFPILIFCTIAFLTSACWHFYTLKMDTHAAEIIKKESTNWFQYQTKPVYYYWSFFVQSGIWTIPAFISLLYPYLKNRVFHRKAYLFTLLWTLLSLFLLSVIPQKKTRYLLPVLVPLAMTTAFYIEYLFRMFKTLKSKKETFPVYFNFGLIAFIGIVFPVGGHFFLNERLQGNWVWFVLLSLALFGTGIFMLRHLFRRNIVPVFYSTICFIVAVVWFGLPLGSAITHNPDYRPFSRLKAWEKEQNIKVYEYSEMTPELIWDYGQKLEILKKDTEITIPEEDKFAVLVQEKKLESFKNTFPNYRKKHVGRFDLSPHGKESRWHKARLCRDLFILTKE